MGNSCRKSALIRGSQLEEPQRNNFFEPQQSSPEALPREQDYKKMCPSSPHTIDTEESAGQSSSAASSSVNGDGDLTKEGNHQEMTQQERSTSIELPSIVLEVNSSSNADANLELVNGCIPKATVVRLHEAEISSAIPTEASLFAEIDEIVMNLSKGNPAKLPLIQLVQKPRGRKRRRSSSFEKNSSKKRKPIRSIGSPSGAFCFNQPRNNKYQPKMFNDKGKKEVKLIEVRHKWQRQGKSAVLKHSRGEENESMTNVHSIDQNESNRGTNDLKHSIKSELGKKELHFQSVFELPTSIDEDVPISLSTTPTQEGTSQLGLSQERRSLRTFHVDLSQVESFCPTTKSHPATARESNRRSMNPIAAPTLPLSSRLHRNPKVCLITEDEYPPK